MKPRIETFFFYFIFVISCIGRSASISSQDFLGIAPEDENYFKALSSSGAIKCRDGSKKFTKSQLNDDFCDCPDGTDEPGTSACPKGKFHCRNAGHVPLSLFSSRVNDGICDCCDGSDEYDGRVKCSNTCWEAGKVARDRLRKKIATYQEGMTLRKKEIEQAKLAIAKDEAELSKLKNDEKMLKVLVEQLKEHKEQIEKVEEKERLQREKEEREKREAEEALNDKNKAGEEVEMESKTMEDTDHETIGLLEDSLMDQEMTNSLDDSGAKVEHTDSSESEGSMENEVQDDVVKKVEETSTAGEHGADAHADAVNKEKDTSENMDSLSREELGRRVASRWTGDNTEQQSGQVDDVKHDHHEISGEEQKDVHDEEYEEYDSESENDDQKYSDDDEEDHVDDLGEEHDDSISSYKSDDEPDFSDTTASSNPSWLEKIQQTVKNILKALNLFKTPVNITEAARVRKEYDEFSAKLSKIQSRISSLTKKLNHDFGPEKEFYSFYDKCFESKENKYIYKICPFRQASQEEGHSTSRLGSWQKFEDSYRVMVFSNGDKCWNGPDRSLKARLRCGLKNELADVDEPSRCEYVALLSTPVVCLEEKLRELQEKLDLLDKEQPQGHEEL